jgi:hypothetical protein
MSSKSLYKVELSKIESNECLARGALIDVAKNSCGDTSSVQ